MKKMKIILVLLAIATAVPFYSGCKKGEKDPFLSLRSRDKRLMGEWKVTMIDGTTTRDAKGNRDGTTGTAYYLDTVKTTTITFDGSTLTMKDAYTYSGYPSPYFSSYTETNVFSTKVELTLEEHGLAIATEENTLTSITTSHSPADINDGIYNPATPTTTKSNYEGIWRWATGRKNKEMLILEGCGMMDGTYIVTQLKNREIILTQSSVDNFENSGGNTASVNISDKSEVILSAK